MCLQIQGIYCMYKQIHVLIWFVKGGKGRARGSANFGKLADKQIFNATLVGSSGRQGLSLCVWECGSTPAVCTLHFPFHPFPSSPVSVFLSLSALICWLTHLKSCFWKLPPSPFGNGQTNLVAAKQCKHLNCDTWSPTNLPVFRGWWTEKEREGSGLGRPRVSHFWPLKSVESRGGIWNCCLPSIVSIVCSSSSQVAALLIITVPLPSPLFQLHSL